MDFGTARFPPLPSLKSMRAISRSMKVIFALISAIERLVYDWEPPPAETDAELASTADS